MAICISCEQELTEEEIAENVDLCFECEHELDEDDLAEGIEND